MATGYQIATKDFDRTLLPADAGEPGTESFRLAVTKYLQEEYRDLGGVARIIVSEDYISVSWAGTQSPLDVAIEKLTDGDYQAGVALLRKLLRITPHNSEVLYNLGMALSDLGELAEAEQYLSQVAESEPDNVNALVALGVLFQRQGRTEEGLQVLKKAVEIEDTNPWAQRNLGGLLLKSGRDEEAKQHLLTATKLNPSDQNAWFGLGQAYERLEDDARADEAYEEAIALDPNSDLGELAKQRRSAIGQKEMRSQAVGGIRPDAMMYCLAALEKFSGMPLAEVQKCGFEIAIRGQQGFDFNDSTPKYQFRTLEGKFSGLHALSYMYVAFRYIDPSLDMGFDLSREYEAAKALFKGHAP